jgi:hypothetical protein
LWRETRESKDSRERERERETLSTDSTSKQQTQSTRIVNVTARNFHKLTRRKKTQKKVKSKSEKKRRRELETGVPCSSRFHAREHKQNGEQRTLDRSNEIETEKQNPTCRILPQKQEASFYKTVVAVLRR